MRSPPGSTDEGSNPRDYEIFPPMLGPQDDVWVNGSSYEAGWSSELRIASTSTSIWNFLLTRTPPVSRTWFHVMPKSSRSISPEAAKEATVLPQGFLATPRNSPF